MNSKGGNSLTDFLKPILQGIIIVVTFASWDFYVKDIFYNWATSGGEINFLHALTGYSMTFAFGYLLSKAVVKTLSSDETDIYSGHE